MPNKEINYVALYQGGGGLFSWFSNLFGGKKAKQDDVSTDGNPLGVGLSSSDTNIGTTNSNSTSKSKVSNPNSFGSLQDWSSLGNSVVSGVGSLLNAGQIASPSQKTEALADGALNTVSTALSAFGPVGSLVGTGLKLVNSIGGSLMNNNSTAKAADAFKVNSAVQQSGSYGGVLSAAQDAMGDGKGYKKAGIVGKLATNTQSLKREFNTSAVQQNLASGVLAQGKQAIDGGLASQDMYAARNQNSLYGGNPWQSGAITYGKKGTSIHIKPSHEGKFTAYKERTGKSTSESLQSSDPHVRKMAQFAANAKKWKHQEGGKIGGKIGVPNPGPQVPHGGIGSSLTRPTAFAPQEQKQKVENKGDLGANTAQKVAVANASKQPFANLTLPMQGATPFPVSSDIMSMVSTALSGTISSPNQPIEPDALPTMQMGGALAANKVDDLPPANIPLSPPPNKGTPNPSAMMGSLASNNYRKLTPTEMGFWNGFVDYVNTKGYKGNPDLDVRDKGLSSNLYNEYAKQQNFNISYDHFIPTVQANIKQQRQMLIDNARKGQVVLDGLVDRFGKNNTLDVGDEELNKRFMPGLSQVDGWAGSRTTSYKFPMANPPKVTGFIPGDNLQDQKKYKKALDFTQFGDGSNGGQLINTMPDTPNGTGLLQKHKDGGPINIIADGALHAHKHNMEDLPLLEGSNITSKGIPVVVLDSEGGVIQQAEVEKNELILHHDLTKVLEALMQEGSEESAIAAGKLLAREIVKNTKDSKDKILKTA